VRKLVNGQKSGKKKGYRELGPPQSNFPNRGFGRNGKNRTTPQKKKNWGNKRSSKSGTEITNPVGSPAEKCSKRPRGQCRKGGETKNKTKTQTNNEISGGAYATGEMFDPRSKWGKEM